MKQINLNKTPPPFWNNLTDKAKTQLTLALIIGYTERLRRMVDEIEYQKRMEQKQNGN